MKSISKFFKNNYKEILLVLIVLLIVTIKLPYYIMMPGGTLDISDKVNINNNKINGSLNLLYVSSSRATIPTYLISLLNSKWDLEKISEQQISDETTEEIDIRNKVMLDNSVDNAIYVAYNANNSHINIIQYENTVIGVDKDTNCDIKIGDDIRKINDNYIRSVKDITNILDNSNVGDKVSITYRRDMKENTKVCEIRELNGQKRIGIYLVTNEKYNVSNDVKLSFKPSESGASGGLMLALSIYDLISNEDLVRGRKIAGTGAIDKEGNVEEIAGIKHKIMGAHKKGIKIVLVPKENYEEAIKVKNKYNYKMDIVSISTFSEAINYLKGE